MLNKVNLLELVTLGERIGHLVVSVQHALEDGKVTGEEFMSLVKELQELAPQFSSVVSTLK